LAIFETKIIYLTNILLLKTESANRTMKLARVWYIEFCIRRYASGI